jgi:hypothetical protein
MKPGRLIKSPLYLPQGGGYGGDDNIKFEYELFFKVNARLKSGHLLYLFGTKISIPPLFSASFYNISSPLGEIEGATPIPSPPNTPQSAPH